MLEVYRPHRAMRESRVFQKTVGQPPKKKTEDRLYFSNKIAYVAHETWPGIVLSPAPAPEKFLESCGKKTGKTIMSDTPNTVSPWRSIRVRVTLLMLAILLAGLWGLAFFVSHVLKTEIEGLIGEQQRASASLLARNLGYALSDRLQDLNAAATVIAPLISDDPAAVQRRLESLPLLVRRFNDGIFATDAQGTALADVPLASGRAGRDMRYSDAVATTLSEGTPTIGRPAMGHHIQSPVLGISIPIRNARGQLIGSLTGVTDLSKPNFLDLFEKDQRDTTNNYLLVDRRHRLIVTATDRSRILEPSPPPGQQPAIDGFLAGLEGTQIFLNPRGVEVIQSVRQIPLAGWYVAVSQSTENAFALIRAMQQRMLVATLALSLLACASAWWLLRRELSPLFDSMRVLSQLAQEESPRAGPSALPVTRDNEIGQLIRGFNHLLSRLAQREQHLREKSGCLDEAQSISKTGSWTLTMPEEKLECSDEMLRLFGLNPKTATLSLQHIQQCVHPEDQERVDKAFWAAMTARTPYDLNHRMLTPDGQLKWVRSRVQPEFDTAGNLCRAICTVQDITEQKQIVDALEQARHQLDSIVDNMPAMVFLKRADDLRFVLFNRAGENLLGHAASHLLGKNDYDLFPKEQADAFTSRDRDVLASHEVIDIPAEKITTATGETKVLYTRKIALRDTEDRPTHLLGISVDITDRKQAEAELRVAATAFESQEGMLITDAHGVIQRVNRAFTKITGYPAEEVVGKTPRLLRSGRHDDAFYHAMWKTIAATGGWQGEVWDRHKDGQIYPSWLTISAVRDEDGVVTHYVGAQYDITDRKQSEERIHQLAFFDQLTSLPNRTLLLDRLRQAIAASARSLQHGAVLFIDLDKFKTLNDTLGHDKGDLLLQQVAQRLNDSVRAIDTVARLGGDEFIVMLTNLSVIPLEAAMQTEAVGKKILARLGQPYQLEDAVFHTTASIGATIFSGENQVIDALFKQADLAMYKSKSAGRNTLCFFDPDMETEAMNRAALENDLREAVEQHQFELYYQAQMAHGELVGAEALVRWQHPRRGTVSPDEFIALAEETGLIVPLGLWVMETACYQLKAWETQPTLNTLTVAVNVSAHQFRKPDFVDQVREVLVRTGAKAERLKLELTESLLVHEVDNVITKMNDLKAMGIGFALDDFGTGYSSLYHLKHLPLDQLKIDRSFVRDILDDQNDAAIAGAIIALAKNMGLNVIAEGVEIAPQLDFLTELECRAYQGYYFSRPLTARNFETYALDGRE